MKFNILLDYCIGKSAVGLKEFYILPVGDKLMQYDTIAVNTIVKNKDGGVSSCDILYAEDLETYNKQYLKYTSLVAENCQDRDLSNDSMVIGTSAIIDTEIDGAHAGRFLANLQNEILFTIKITVFTRMLRMVSCM